MLEEGQRLNFGCGDSEMFKSVCVSHKHLDKHVCSFSRGLGWRYSDNFRCRPGHSQGIRCRGGNLKVISSGSEVTEGGAGG